MRGSDIAIILFLVSGLTPVASFAQQTTPDANQATQARTGQTQQQHPNQPQTQNFQPGQTQQPSGQAQTQNTKVEPPHTPQQADQLREQERRSAEDTRINRNWTAEQQADEGMKQVERIKQQQAEERMILERLRQRRMAEENEDNQTTSGNWRRDDDDMYRSPRHGSPDRGEGRSYYEGRPYPRVKTCIEYENGDEFCRYRAN
jgi:hypothetical protein